MTKKLNTVIWQTSNYKEALSYLLGDREKFIQFMNLKPITDVQKSCTNFLLNYTYIRKFFTF